MKKVLKIWTDEADKENNRMSNIKKIWETEKNQF